MTTDTTYRGLFGALCRLLPPLDADVPGGWTLLHRSYRHTVWRHPRAGINLSVKKGPHGWNVHVVTPEHGTVRTYPRSASRREAFRAAREFLEGEPLGAVYDSDPGILRLHHFLDA